MTAVSFAFISSCVPSSVTVVIQLIEPSGAPAWRAASFMISGDARDAAHRRRMRADHDRAARLDRNQDLVDRRGRRVRRRHDRADDAERFRDLDDLAILDPADHADGFHRPDEVVDLLRGEEVLLDLVGDDAVAGFLVRETGERFGLRRDGRGHRVDERSICSWENSASAGAAAFARLRERPGLGDGGEVAVRLGGGHRCWARRLTTPWRPSGLSGGPSRLPRAAAGSRGPRSARRPGARRRRRRRWTP